MARKKPGEFDRLAADFGGRMKRVREEVFEGISQQKFGRVLGIGQPAVSDLETGKKGLRLGRLLKALAVLDAKGVRLEYLVFGQEPIKRGKEGDEDAALARQFEELAERMRRRAAEKHDVEHVGDVVKPRRRKRGE